MEVKIGVQYATRELVVEVDEPGEAVEKLVAEALGRPDGLFALTDLKGRRVVVPAAKLAYVEIGSPSVGQVGFRS
jgi:3-hydroxyacyl-CoA dehydrogenase